jgi:serine/threonine protein kinase
MDMVFREAEVLRSLNHKHIVKVYNSYILKNTQIAIVMELLEGGELAQRLKTEGKFTEDVACKYFK